MKTEITFNIIGLFIQILLMIYMYRNVIKSLKVIFLEKIKDSKKL